MVDGRRGGPTAGGVRDGQAAWVRLWPRTGRRHQLRLHCAKVLQTPILGDSKYGGAAAAERWEVGGSSGCYAVLAWCSCGI